MLVFGIISFGIIFHHKLSLGDGAREAARYGATLPVTNFGSMDQWLDAIAARAIADATGSLDADAPNRAICVAYVYPDGTAAIDQTKRRTENGTSIAYTPAAMCFNDGRPNDERRVQVQLGRDVSLVVILASKTISLSGQSVSRFEASLISS